MTYRPHASITAFLLCGGAGTRLRPVTTQPKALLDVAGWPFLRYPIETVRGVAERIIFLTGHGAAEVEAAFGPGGEAGVSAFSSASASTSSGPSPADPMRVFIREDLPLGTGGALAHARGWAADLNWVANGDSFIDVEARAVIATHRPDEGLIVAVRLADASDYGSLDLGPDGRIRAFLEKGRAGPGIVNAGVYLLDRSLIDDLPEGSSSLERDAFPRWAQAGRLRALVVDAFFRDIGTSERLAAAQGELAAIRARMEARPRG
jgi:NDP-sugar pyrophosphorylase family protein